MDRVRIGEDAGVAVDPGLDRHFDRRLAALLQQGDAGFKRGGRRDSNPRPPAPQLGLPLAAPTAKPA